MEQQKASISLKLFLAVFLGSLIFPIYKSAALEEAAAPAEALVLNAGETRIIDNLSPDSTPTIRVIDNPHALIVHGSDTGKLVLLGAERGKWEISAKRPSGEAVSYDVTVLSIRNPGKPLKPAEMPSADSTVPISGPVASGPSADSIVSPPAEAPASTDNVKSASYKSGSIIAAASPSATSKIGPSATPQSGNSESRIKPLSTQMSQRLFRTDPSIASSGESYSSDAVATNGSSGESHFLPPDGLSMMSGTTRIIDFADRLHRVSIGNTDVADVQVFTPYQINLTAHQPGFTTLTVVTKQGHYEERQIRVDPGGKQQVMLSCVVAQLDRGKIENQGINLAVALQNAGLSFVSLPGLVGTPYSPTIPITAQTPFGPVSTSQSAVMAPGGSLTPLLLSQNLTYGLATNNGQWNTQTFFQMLENHNLAKILAQPNLLANTGEKATFLAGGEIPIVVAQALNTSIVFKEFGTKVTFLPTVVSLNDIELLVEPEVSQPDYLHAVQLFGFNVPAFVTRRAKTLVRLRDGQTLIIAGLNLTERHEIVQKVPYLGDLPFAGALFRNTNYQNTATDLVMTVTPQIVNPLPTGAVAYSPVSSHGPMTSDEIRTKRLDESDAGRPRF